VKTSARCIINDRSLTTKEMSRKIRETVSTGKSATNKSYLWKTVLEKIVYPGSKIAGLLTMEKESTRANPGNPKSKPKTKAQKGAIALAWATLLETHEPKEEEVSVGSFFLGRKKGES
jgi:hypothetical protein